jgi:carbonic anhydrase/acetyltransferase-like protein (isoleucine patch superfamily)
MWLHAGVACWLQVGMGATLLDGVVMEPGSIVAAGAVVPPGEGVKDVQLLLWPMQIQAQQSGTAVRVVLLLEWYCC